MKFDKKFLLGGSSSAIQIDGEDYYKKTLTNFHILFKENPEKFHNQVGPQITNSFMKYYKEDLSLMSSIGIEILRHSFNWAKLFPTNDFTKPNLEVVEYYHDLIKEMKINNIKPMMTISHFDLPDFICDKGGLIWDGYPAEYAKYATFILKEYGNEVDYIATFNEPFVQCSSSYLFNGIKGHWPLKNDLSSFLLSCENIIIANALVLKEHNRNNFKTKLGIVLDFTAAEPRNKYNTKDIEAVNFFNGFKEEIFSYPMLKGFVSNTVKEMLKTLGLKSLFEKTENQKLIFENRSEWLGANYYTRNWIKENECKIKRTFLDFFSKWDNPVIWINKSRNWEIAPEGIYKIGLKIKENYDNIEWFVTENGIGIENENDFLKNDLIVDDYRINFIDLHLQEIKKLLEIGSNCKGYMMWTPIDSWSFMNGYKNRYGLISIDLKNQKRTLKKSAIWFRKIVKEKNGG